MGIQINGQTDTISAVDGSITVATDLTVPGALTYDDVTNIDSVGVVTARNGLHVTGGSVGIGLNNPDLKLHVNGTNALPSKTGSSPTGHLTLRAKAQSSSHGMFMGVSNAAPWSSWIQAQDVNTNSTNYPLLLNPNGGNVGIGTDNPDQTLHLYDNTAFASFTNNADTGESGILFRRNDNNQNRGKVTYSFTDDALLFRASNNGSGEDLRITSAGNVGIGTDDPQVKLTVSSNSPAVCDIHHIDGGTNDEARIILGALAANPPSNRGAGIAAVNNGAGHDLIIKCSASHSVSPTEKVRITSAGNLGIGDASPTKPLTVGTTTPVILLDDQSSRTLEIRGPSTTHSATVLTTSVHDLLLGTNNTERLRIRSNGQTLIGGATAPYSEYNATNANWNGGHYINVGGSTQWGTLHIADWDDSTTKDSYGGTNIFLSRCKSETIGDHSGGALGANNPIARLLFNGSDGADFRNAAWIESKVDGTPGSNNMPGLLSFATSSGSGAAPVERLRLTSNGMVRVTDSASLSFGNNDDMRIFHDGGSANYIDVYNKDLYIRCNRDSGITGGDIVLQPKSGENSAIFRDDGNVELYYDNALKLETVSNGTKTTGRIFLNGTNGGFDYNNTAHTLEFLVSNGTTHSELTHNAYVPSASGTRHLGYANKRWDTLYVDRIAFGGSANTNQHSLDDYEEGTWTPAIGNTGYSYTYSVQEGQYTKIGRLVTLRFRIVVTARSGSASGGHAIINLPITSDGALDGSSYAYAMPSELIVHKVGTNSTSGTITLLFGGLTHNNTSNFWVNNPTNSQNTPFDLGSDFHLGGVITYTA